MAGNFLLIELKEFNTASLTGSYQTFGSVLANPATKIQIINTSNVDVYISKDNSTNWIRVPPGSITFDESTVRVNQADAAYYLAKGIQLYVKQVTAPGAGAIWAHVVTRALP